MLRARILYRLLRIFTILFSLLAAVIWPSRAADVSAGAHAQIYIGIVLILFLIELHSSARLAYQRILFSCCCDCRRLSMIAHTATRCAFFLCVRKTNKMNIPEGNTKKLSHTVRARIPATAPFNSFNRFQFYFVHSSTIIITIICGDYFE